MSAFAQWLNTAFAGFDRAILEFYHNLAITASPILTPISEFLAVIGDGAMFCFILAAILILFSKTRKIGLSMAFGVGFGAIFTNLLIKNIVARPRPYVSGFEEWWQYAGASVESEYSFPSGHTTAAMAGMTALCICLFVMSKTEHRKIRFIAIPAVMYVLLMGASRNYLMVHYPTDVIAGIITGALGGVLGFLLIHFLYLGIEGNKDVKFCSFFLEADISHLFKKNADK